MSNEIRITNAKHSVVADMDKFAVTGCHCEPFAFVILSKAKNLVN